MFHAVQWSKIKLYIIDHANFCFVEIFPDFLHNIYFTGERKNPVIAPQENLGKNVEHERSNPIIAPSEIYIKNV